MIIGVSNPQLLNKGDFHELLARKRIPLSNVLIIEESALTKLKTAVYKPGFAPGFRPLQFTYFKDQKLVGKYASCEGGLKKKNILGNFPPKEVFPSKDFPSLQQFFQKNQIHIPSSFNSELLKNEHVFLIFWGSWMKKSFSHIKQLQAYRRKHAEKDISLVFVNLFEAEKGYF